MSADATGTNATPERWWVIHDDAIRYALKRVADGGITKEEAYAMLIENSDIEQIDGPRND